MPTPRAVWSEKELDQMEVVLDRLPDDAIQENPDLVEIRRAQKDYDQDDTGAWVEKPSGAGETGDGRIAIFDRAMTSTSRHAGDSSEIAGIHDLARFQQTLAHEVGHVMDDRQSADADAVRKAAGWQSESGGDATKKLAETKAGGVASDGRVYVEKDGEISSFDPALIPEGGAHTDETEHKETWDYARSKPRDYFAEMYAKSVTTPELLYKDMVEAPQAKLEELRKNGASPAEIAEAERVATSMAEQHATMRKEVFHIDPETDAARERSLAARADELGLDEEGKKQLLADYRKQAQQAMTQEQLDVVYQTYDDASYTDY